jgi:hypothetical protein
VITTGERGVGVFERGFGVEELLCKDLYTPILGQSSC